MNSPSLSLGKLITAQTSTLIWAETGIKTIAAVNSQCPLWVDTVEKGFWEGYPSNIDSKTTWYMQDRFKRSASLIQLLRSGGVPRTFFNSIGHKRTNRPGQNSDLSAAPESGQNL